MTEELESRIRETLTMVADGVEPGVGTSLRPRAGVSHRRWGTALVAVVVVAAVGAAAALDWMRGRSDVVVDSASVVSELELVDGLVVPVLGSPVQSEGALVYRGALGPEPAFDVSGLGTEMALSDGPPEALVVPPSANPLERNALRADRIVYLGDINTAQMALHVFEGELCLFAGNRTPVSGSGTCPVPGGPLDGAYDDPPIGGWTVWAYVPPETSVVRMVLDDGSSFWQRPRARTVFFNLPDGRDLGKPSLTAYDLDGEILLTVGQA